MAKNWLNKYDNGGPIGPKAAPIKINGTEVFEHGEDTATANKQENGINPTNLTEKGIEYAKSVGQEALKRGKKAVITSDVQRAKETADVIGQTANLPVYNNPILRTWDVGEYDGAPEGSFKEKQWAAKSSTPVPGGESFDSFKARMEKAFEFTETAPKDNDIVTHSKVTRAFKALHDTDGEWTDKTTKKFLNAKDEPKKENGGWLDSYEQGGLVLKQKTHDNYDKQSNYNDADAKVGPGFKGLAYNLQGRNYSPAWGGQFQNGGNLWNTNKKAFVDSTLNANKNLDFVHRLYDPSAGSIQVPGEHGRSTHLMASDKTRVYPEVVNINGHLQHLSGDNAWDYADSTKQYIDFKTPEQADWFASSRDNTSGYKMGTNVLSKIDHKTGKPKMQMGGGLPGAVGFTYTRTINPAPANGKYTKKTLASAQLGKNIPTIEDSTRLYNSQMALNKFYENEMKAGRIKKDYESTFLNEVNNKDLRNANLKFYRNQIQQRSDRGIGAWDDDYKKIFNMSPEQIRQLEYKSLAQTKSGSEYQEYYRDLVTPMQNLASPFALVDKRIVPQRKISYSPIKSGTDYPGGNVTVYDYDPILIKPVSMLTPEERALRIKRYGKNSGIQETVSKPIQKPVLKPTPKPEPAPVIAQQPTPQLASQQTVPQPKSLYNYDAEDSERIFAPVPSGGGGAFVGIKKKDGTIQYVKPEDYKRMGVPNYGQEYIKAHQKMQNGGEMRFYQQGLDFTPKTISKNGSVIKDDMGQWAHPGEITEIGSNEITMKGVPYNVIGISDEGDIKDMKPGKNYKFKGSKVTEYPKGGWLNKYK
jgi:probable phosphoglycerate mutase